MRHAMAALTAILLAGCMTPATQPAEPPLPEVVALTINSWGVPLHDWRIAADGTGRYTYAERKEGANFHDVTLVTKAIDASPADFAQIAGTLASAERYARGATLDCRREITDMPYGELRWVRDGVDATLRYDLGCRSPDAGRVYEAIAAAQDRMENLAETARVIETRSRQP